MATLINARATKIEVINNLTETGEINIDLIHEYSVSYSDDWEHCRAELKAGFAAKGQPDLLKVSCTVVGDFAIQKITTDEDKINMHIACYYVVFPYAQSLITRLCADAGLPPYYLQAMEMKAENVIINK